MEKLLEPMVADSDPRRHFLSTYLRTTKAVAAELDRGGFVDRDWVERWDVAFADLYLDALEAPNPPEPWRVAFAAGHRPDVPPLRHVLLGMNAHINYDLPQALIAVMSPADFDDPAVRDKRVRDHFHIDTVLSSRVNAEDAELAAAGQPISLVDRLLTPLNRLATKRFLGESRRKVWANAGVLDRARRDGGTAYVDRLAELSRLSAARVADLERPGFVVLRLAAKGFGVQLAGAQA
jgi:hypothetical protein